MPINKSSPYPERPPDEARWNDENYIGHDFGHAGGLAAPAAAPNQDPEGHHLMTRMNALVLLRKLNQVEVDAVLEAKDWKRARRLIRSVRDTRPLPEQP
jgi:hypothetical protein